MLAKGLNQDIIYKKTLVTPPALEKVFKSDPDMWNVLSQYIMQKEGPPSVAASTDPRPEVGSVGAQFEALS